MREILECRECGAPVRIAEEPGGTYVLVDAVPVAGDDGVGYLPAGAGRVIPSRERVSFKPHPYWPQCPASHASYRRGAVAH